MSRNIKDEDAVFAQLIKDVVTVAQSETKTEEAQRVFDAVHFYLTSWLREVEEINPLFKVNKLIGVGSYAEGTKIIKADEFDFLAVVDEFSKPNLLRVDPEELNVRDGLVKINVVDEELKSKCGQLYKDGHLRCFQPVNFPKFDEKRFGHVFIEAVLLYAKKNKLKLGSGDLSPIGMACSIQLPDISGISLTLKGVQYNTPNVLINFKYKNMEISVDLSPAIRYYQPKDCFKIENCAGPVLAELVLRRKSLLLIGTKNESDFKITITEAEVEYIKTVMKKEHKTIYILLKYITNIYKGKIFRIAPFTSYMMKTVCFHHDIKCEAEKPSIKQCFRAVIGDLEEIITQKGYVNSIVDRRINLRSSFNDIISLFEDHRTCMLGDMMKLSSLPIDIQTVEAFDGVLAEYVRTEKIKRDKVQEENWKVNQERWDERQQKLSQIADMGFRFEDVESAMNSALGDQELALKILKWKKENEDRKDKGLTETDVNLTKEPILGLPAPDQSNVPEECNDNTSGELTDTTRQSQNASNQPSSEPICEVIYQGQKDD